MWGTKELISVIESKNIGNLSAFLEKMDLDEINGKYDRETALHFACRRHYNEAVDFLVSRNGVDVNVKTDGGGSTPLHLAIHCTNTRAISKILTNPQVDVNAQDNYGWTPLHVACDYDHGYDVSRLLARPEVNVNVKNLGGITPVMCAARQCHEKVLKLLLEDPRVNLDDKDKDGRGLEVQVGYDVKRQKWDSKRRTTCLEMINNERRKRENIKLEQEQQSQDGNIGQHIEKVDKLNKEMGDVEKKWKENLDIRKQKRRDLNQRQNLEKKMMTKKHKEDEAALKKKHKDEESMLETTFVKEDQIEQRHIAILRERRDELAQNLQKLTIDPAQDTSEDHDKLEAAKRSLECPVCMDVMRPPTRIWMCVLSHIICEPCKDLLDRKDLPDKGKCPTCITERVTLRAFVAENFASSIFND